MKERLKSHSPHRFISVSSPVSIFLDPIQTPIPRILARLVLIAIPFRAESSLHCSSRGDSARDGRGRIIFEPRRVVLVVGFYLSVAKLTYYSLGTESAGFGVCWLGIIVLDLRWCCQGSWIVPDKACHSWKASGLGIGISANDSNVLIIDANSGDLHFSLGLLLILCISGKFSSWPTHCGRLCLSFSWHSPRLP